jgi:hypothetical protein
LIFQLAALNHKTIIESPLCKFVGLERFYRTQDISNLDRLTWVDKNFEKKKKPTSAALGKKQLPLWGESLKRTDFRYGSRSFANIAKARSTRDSARKFELRCSAFGRSALSGLKSHLGHS